MKELKVRCFFGINRDNHTNESVFEIQDDSTGMRICSIKFGPEELVQLLGRMGAVKGEGIFLEDDNYRFLGKTKRIDSVKINVTDIDFVQRDEYALQQCQSIVDDLNDGYEWFVDKYLGSKNNTQHIGEQTFRVVKIFRYE